MTMAFRLLSDGTSRSISGRASEPAAFRGMLGRNCAARTGIAGCGQIVLISQRREQAKWMYIDAVSKLKEVSVNASIRTIRAKMSGEGSLMRNLPRLLRRIKVPYAVLCYRPSFVRRERSLSKTIFGDLFGHCKT